MAKNIFGGMTGKAEEQLRSRKSRLDAAEEEAMGNKPKQEEKKKKEEKSPRPGMSKKWYE